MQQKLFAFVAWPARESTVGVQLRRVWAHMAENHIGQSTQSLAQTVCQATM
jgi:hypothetical protein